MSKWVVILYLHVAARDRIAQGTWVSRGGDQAPPVRRRSHRTHGTYRPKMAANGCLLAVRCPWC